MAAKQSLEEEELPAKHIKNHFQFGKIFVPKGARVKLLTSQAMMMTRLALSTQSLREPQSSARLILRTNVELFVFCKYKGFVLSRNKLFIWNCARNKGLRE